MVVSCAPKTAEDCIRKVKFTRNTDKQEALYLNALDFDSTCIPAYDFLGWRYANSDSVGRMKSRVYFQQFLQRDSSNANPWMGLGYTYLVECRDMHTRTDQKLYQAIIFFSKALELDSTYCTCYYHRAECNQYLGKDSLMKLDLEKACYFDCPMACFQLYQK